MMRQLDILNTHMALILPYVANAIRSRLLYWSLHAVAGEIEEARLLMD